MNFTQKLLLNVGSVFLSLIILSATAMAQIQEPDVRPTPRNISTIQEGYKTGFGIDINMNNFGFGLGGEFRRVIAPQTEGTLNFGITGLRDASEQTFTDIFFGQQIVPNKYKRAFAMPVMLGVRQRVFSDLIQDDYRFFVSVQGGGVAAFAFPYFDDINDSGFRENLAPVYVEPINDIFTGWSEGDWHFGGVGQFKIGVDIGSNLAKLNSIEFGYLFYYFPDGIQMMSPNQPVLVENRAPGQFPYQVEDPNDPINTIIFEDFFSPQRFFGSPQITFTFGWFWK
jgi:hypothetical protein